MRKLESYKVEFENLDSETSGKIQYGEQRIIINSSLGPSQKFLTLLHERTHEITFFVLDLSETCEKIDGIVDLADYLAFGFRATWKTLLAGDHGLRYLCSKVLNRYKKRSLFAYRVNLAKSDINGRETMNKTKKTQKTKEKPKRLSNEDFTALWTAYFSGSKNPPVSFVQIGKRFENVVYGRREV